MGTLTGNLLALVVVVISTIIGLIWGLFPGGVVFISASYVLFAIIVMGNYSTRPNDSHTLCSLLPPTQREAFRTYHLFIRFPGASTAYSALLNLLRMAGLVWGIWLIIRGHYIVGALCVSLFASTSLFIVRFDPIRYLLPGIRNGNTIASEQLSLIESVQSRYAHFHSTYED